MAEYNYIIILLPTIQQGEFSAPLLITPYNTIGALCKIEINKMYWLVQLQEFNN